MKNTLHRIAALSMFAAPCLHATDFIVVTTLADEDNGTIDPAQGTGVSLREAIRHPGSDPNDLALVITFSPELAGETTWLTQGQLTTVPAMDFVSITGPITISRHPDSPLGRILEVPDRLNLALNRVRISGGDAGTGGSGGNGGGILLYGGLDMGSCEILGNRAKNGGGLYVAPGGFVTSMIKCNFEGNLAGFNGGAFDNQGSIGTDDVVVRCTFSGNSASQGGGAIQQQGTNEFSKTLLLDHCTLSGNSAQFGGAIDGDGTSVIELRNCTITNNSATKGGGIEQGAAGGEIHLHHSIVAGNSAPAPLGPDQGGPDIFGPITDQGDGANLIGSLVGVTGTYTGLVGAPVLGPLSDNGGITKTHSPLPGSPAINAGGTGGGVDQRGFPRVSGAAMDLGAVETQAGPWIVTSVDSSGSGSLHEAVLATFPGTTVTFAPALNGSSINVSSGALIIDKALVVDAGDLSEGITLSGRGKNRVFEIAESGDLVLRGVEIANGKSAGPGGALSNEGELTLERSTVRHSLSFADGGGIWNSGQLILLSSTVAGNTSADAGGGIYHSSGDLTVRHSTISGNVSFFGLGGGVLGGDDGVTLDNSIIAGNESHLEFGSADPLGGDYWGAIESGSFDPTLLGHNFIGGDPKLAPLADYGAPTSVMPPLPGSPVIEGAVLLASTPATDQLGNPRPSGPLPDIGAVEAVAFSSLSLADSDSDGIGDVLEPSFGLTVGIDDSAVDSDGDGSTDAEEIGNMTNPFDAADYLRIKGFERISPGPETPNFLISFPTFPGLSYSIESDQNLDFAGPDHLEVVPSFIAVGYSASFEIPLRPTKDFVRVSRN